MIYTLLNEITPVKEFYKLYWNYRYNLDFKQDTFLVSYPRSGNTWLRHILFYCNPAFSNKSIEELDSFIPDMTTDESKTWSSLKSPKIIKSHNKFYYPFHKVLYLMRDGRDSTISNFKFVSKRYGYKKSFKDYLVNTGDQWPCTWAEHVQSWASKKQNMLIIRYEDLKNEPQREVKKIIDFIGWEYDISKINDAVTNSTIKQMKVNENKLGINLNEVGSGVAGEWKDQYSDEELEIFYSYSKEALKKFGYYVQ